MILNLCTLRKLVEMNSVIPYLHGQVSLSTCLSISIYKM